MTLTKLASSLRRGDAIRVGKKKAVVTDNERASETASLSYLPLIDKGKLLGQTEVWTSLRANEQVPVIGKWAGDVRPGASGQSIAPNGAEGEGHMATTRTRKGAAKKGTAKKSSNSKPRASNEELDELAAQVVDLRDNEDKSWGEIEEELGINPGRLRSLYNRGGGKPTRTRKGSAKAAPKPKKGSTRRSGRKAKPKEDPSE